MQSLRSIQRGMSFPACTPLRICFLVAILFLSQALAEQNEHHHTNHKHHDHHVHDHDHDHSAAHHSHDHHSHDHTHSHPPFFSKLSALPEKMTNVLRSALAPLHNMHPERAAFTASLITSSVSFISLLLLPFSDVLSTLLLPFAAGALLSDLCNHLLPHVYASHAPTLPLLVGVALFALLDAVLQRVSGDDHTHHQSASHSTSTATHAQDSHPPLNNIKDAYINLVADALHNFCDGLSLAAAFLVSPSAGVATTIAIIMHEVPQELADYAVLVRAGFSRPFAVFANAVCAATALLGTFVALRVRSITKEADVLILPFAAGALLYMTFCAVLPHVVHDISKPDRVNGKEVRISLARFLQRSVLALLSASTGCFIVALVEQAHEH